MIENVSGGTSIIENIDIGDITHVEIQPQIPEKEEVEYPPIYLETINKDNCAVCKEDHSKEIEIDTGFSLDGKLDLKKEDGEIKTHVPLYVEHTLSEFKTEVQKENARTSLDVPSKSQVKLLLIQTKSEVANEMSLVYATKEEVDALTAGDFNLTNYFTKQEVENKFLNVYSKEEINNLLNNYISEDKIDLKLENHYTKKLINDKLLDLTKLLETSLNLLDTYPTKGSLNGVTSDGVWLHVDDTVGAIHRFADTI